MYSKNCMFTQISKSTACSLWRGRSKQPALCAFCIKKARIPSHLVEVPKLHVMHLQNVDVVCLESFQAFLYTGLDPCRAEVE